MGIPPDLPVVFAWSLVLLGLAARRIEFEKRQRFIT